MHVLLWRRCPKGGGGKTPNMKHIKNLTLLTSLLLGFTMANAQKVSNIQPKLVGNTMQISFDISEAAFNQKFNVQLFISTDGGKTWQGPVSLINDKKNEFAGGTNTITWDIFKDINSLDNEINFDIRAKVIEETVERHFFIEYSSGLLLSSTNYITPLGFRLGSLGKTGWYLAGYFNTFKNATYNYNGESFEESIFYEFTDKTIYPRMAITGGLTFQVGWKSYLFAGAGYATKKYYTQINELNADSSLKNPEQWVNMTTYEESGVEIEAGAIFNFNKINFSLGLSTFNFKQIGANAGIGIAF